MVERSLTDVKIHVGRDRYLREHFAVGDEAGDRRIDGQRLADLAGLIQLANLLVGDVPQLQPLACRTQQRLRALRDFLVGRAAERALAALGDQVLLLAWPPGRGCRA